LSADPVLRPPIANPVQPVFAASRDDTTVVSIGPSHPATHGTVQIIAEMDAEKVVRTDVHCGYLHRGFEKECEDHTWHNLMPYVDRLNYCSALINNFAYCDAVEQLMGIEITPRTRYLRTLLAESDRGAASMLTIGFHLRISGRPARFAAVGAILAMLARLGDQVWVARRADIAAHFRAIVAPPMGQSPARADHLMLIDSSTSSPNGTER